MTRWHYDTVARVRSGVAIRFDTIVEATGGKSGLREVLVGPENVVSLRSQGRAAAQRDPSLNSFFDDPQDHCAKFVESDFCCPPGLRNSFARALLYGDDGEVPDELPGLVSNIDASILRKPIQKVGNVPGIAARMEDEKLDIPADWVVVECRLNDSTVARYQIEGPLPQAFDFGGKRVPTRDYIKRINPLSLLLRLLYAMGVPFEAIDRRQLVEFYSAENSQGDASDIVAVWIGSFKSLRLGGELARWCGHAAGTDAIEYAIVGEALQNAWYRFGVGVDDTVAAASRFAELIELPPEARLAEARRFEHVMTARSIQVLYHLYAIAQRTEQNMLSSLLTECYMDEQQASDLTEARLREEARQGAEILAAENDVRSGRADPLLQAALAYRRELCCRRFLDLLTSASGDSVLFKRRMQPARMRVPGWRQRAVDTLSGALSPRHREMLMPLVEELPSQPGVVNGSRHQERIIELALGRYAWASPWVRACALRALDLSTPGAMAVMERAASGSDSLVAETAAALLSITGSGAPFPPDTLGAAANITGTRGPCVIVDKVAILRKVSLFNVIVDEELAKIAALLIERWAACEERIVEQDAPGDCLYTIASGRVRVHQGERTLRFLGPQDFFGELSLLDAEPRTASVTAVEPTHLFRLDQADFYALISEQPEILPAINRTLCRMIRNVSRSESSPQGSHLIRDG
jgi:CRP/FNR family cyclic AMP-dependent transcriptional regulator